MPSDLSSCFKLTAARMIMKYANVTNIKDFVLVGFPGLPPEYYGAVAALFVMVLLAIVVANAFVLVIILWEHSLHKPSYFVFFHLALSDVSFGLVTLPKIISRYAWNDTMMTFAACFAQMYFVHALGSIHSLILLVMALDRFVAICFSLRYPAVITNRSVMIGCSLCWVGTLIRLVAIVLHALTLPYCDKNIITHCYCDHISITSLGCGPDVSYVKMVSLGIALVQLLVPLGFIIFSYFTIIVSVLRMSQTESRHKVMSTCLPQIFITCLYYLPRCFVYIAHNLGFTFNMDIRLTITMMYSLIPAFVNPLIYCYKTKEIKDILVRKWNAKKLTGILKN